MHKHVRFLGVLLFSVFVVSSCAGFPHVIYQQDSHQESWIRFYRLNVSIPGQNPVLSSNVSLRGEYTRVAINPIDKEHMVYWEKTDGSIYWSYENEMKSVTNSEFFKSLKIPDNAREIFIDYAGKTSQSRWRRTHFLYFVDSIGAIWGVNTATESVDRYCENILIPPYAKSVQLLFGNSEYPVIYVNADGSPTRVNVHNGREEVFLNIIIEKYMMVDEVREEVYEIDEENGLIRYDARGNSLVIGDKYITDSNIVAPRIIDGILYFGIRGDETITTMGKPVL